MHEHYPRIIGTLVGNIFQKPGAAYTKYHYFFEAIDRYAQMADIYDADLQGVGRWINALKVFNPNMKYWRSSLHKNVPAFQSRTRRVARYLDTVQDRAEAVIQLGVLFNSFQNNTALTGFLYTDYTSKLSAQKPSSGRSPFTPQQLDQWIALETQTFQQAVHIFTRSDIVRQSIEIDYNISSNKITTVGGGVNFAALPPMDTKKEREVTTGLFIGKGFYRKGGDLLLQAFAEVRKSCPADRLIMVTSENIPEHLLPDGVEIIRTTWDREKIDKLYRQADYFVLPSRLETWGDVLLEAMSYGLPCIGVKEDAMPEIIVDGQTGFLVPPEDTNALVNALVDLISDPLLRRRLGQAGRQRVESRYTWDIIAEHIVSIMRKNMSRKSALIG